MAPSDDPGTDVFQQTAVPLGATVVLVVSDGRPPVGTPSVVVPDVVGSAQADAQAAMRRSGLRPHSLVQPNGSFPRGAVVGQWPRPGDPAAVSGAAALLVSSGPPDHRMALVGVPNMIGHPEAGAAGMLERIGLQPAKVNVLSPTVPAGIVIAQLPEERAAAPKRRRGPWPWILGALVALVAVLAVAVYATRSTTATVVVPPVVGLSQAAAKQALADAKLEAGTITERASTDTSPGTVLSQDPAKDSKVDEGSKVDLVVAAKSELIVVPDVRGSSRDDAVSKLSAAGLRAAVTEAPNASVPAGAVVSQSPEAGQQVPAGTQVGITVSTGAAATTSAATTSAATTSAATTVDVPNVVGLPVATATQKLGTAGLGATPFEDYNDTVAAGNIISQAPGAGTPVATGTPVAMIVSRGPAPTQTPDVKVPDVVGNTLADARTALEAAGLAVSGVKTDGSGKPADEVLYQTPGAGQTVPKGSQVVLVVSSGS